MEENTVMHIDASEFQHVGVSERDRESITRPSLTFFQDAVRRLVKNRVAMFCLVILFIMVLFFRVCADAVTI
jgi:oligopeptide transport system permease protein